MIQQGDIERLARRYPRVIRWSDEDGCYIGSLPDLCGDCTDAPTAAEVAQELDEIAEEVVAIYLEKGDKLPPPKGVLRDIKAFTEGDVGRAIKNLRELRGLTQKALAELLGCSLSTLIKWENGLRHPSGAAARLLAVLYNHPELVHGTELAAE